MPHHRSHRRVVLPGVVVIVMSIVLTTFGFLYTRHAVKNEERQMLEDRASEVAALLSTASTARRSLDLVGVAYNSDPTGAAFGAAAEAITTGAVTAVGVVKITNGEAVLRDIKGSGPEPGALLSGERAELMKRANQAGELTSTLIPGEGMSTLVVALGRSDGLVVYQEAMLPNTPTPITGNSPFAKLDGVLYRTTEPDLDNILIRTTDRLPLEGRVDRRHLTFGSEEWLLETRAREPLASREARMLPWTILLVGLTASALFAGVVIIIARRRAYALELVDQRTLELRRTLEQLEVARSEADAANRAKNEFLSRISHELRTPLNAVLGFAQLLDREDRPVADREAAAHILRAGRHLLALINEILDISRIESGEIALSTESVHACEVIQESVDLMRPLADECSISFDVDGDACDVNVFADRQRLKQILLNLLSNAIKYNRVDGHVTVACERSGLSRVRVKVTDTGAGIAPEDLGLLFVPFERLGAANTEIEGTGIGLALSRRLAEAMGGSLHVESEVGVGSTFSVELPIVEGADERFERLGSGSDAHTVAVATGRSSATVLYIEDNLTNITLLQRVLSDHPEIEIVTAMQGRIGLDLARRHQPDAILLDLHLPDMSGEEVLRTLRSDPLTKTIPVVVVSADATHGQTQRMEWAGATDYITKPFDLRRLHAAVLDALPVLMRQ